MKKDDHKIDKDLEAEVWSAISAFEQILEAMPNDRASLDALWNAYEQIGDASKAKDYLIRLGNVLMDEGDLEAAAELLEKVKAHADEDPAAQELATRIGATVSDETGPTETLTAEAEASPSPAAPVENVRMSFNMADELSFAWNLMEANDITQEEYASIVQDLTEMGSEDTGSTVSVLHVLEARGFKNMEKIIDRISRECSTPVIALSGFELEPDTIALLPLSFVVGRGAFVFESVGKHALAVVMNPYDTQLREDVEKLAARPCHFFMALPSEFDLALDAMSSVQSEAVKVPT